MADGFIPDRKMNHQLMRLIEKDKRRPQFDHRNPNRWTPRGSTTTVTGGGGSGSCMTADVWDLVHPINGMSGTQNLQVVSAATGQKPGPIRWYFKGVADASAPGGDTDSFYYYRNRNDGYMEWTPTAIPVLPYSFEYRKLWLLDISSNVKVYTAAGVDVTSSDLIGAEIAIVPVGNAGMASLHITLEAFKNSTYERVTVIYSASQERSFSQGRPALYSGASFFPAYFSQRQQDLILSDQELCILPSGQNITGTTAAADLASPDLQVTYSQAFTATANPNEYDNLITIDAFNNTSENMTVQYDRDLLFLNHGQTAQLNTNSTFAVTAGGSNSKTLNTTVSAAPGVNIYSIIKGSITATGDTTSKSYQAFAENEELIA